MANRIRFAHLSFKIAAGITLTEKEEDRLAETMAIEDGDYKCPQCQEVLTGTVSRYPHDQEFDDVKGILIPHLKSCKGIRKRKN